MAGLQERPPLSSAHGATGASKQHPGLIISKLRLSETVPQPVTRWLPERTSRGKRPTGRGNLQFQRLNGHRHQTRHVSHAHILLQTHQELQKLFMK